MTMLVSEKNWLGTAVSAVPLRNEAHVVWLEQELKDLDDGLRQPLRQSPLWREKDDLLRSAPGVGALVATRHNPIIKDFYHRLLAVGKPGKLALTACMRKLLPILNALVKSGQPRRPPA